jgi:plastocyanin
MNTRKQVLIMTVLLLLMLVTIAAYGAWYPSRAEDSEEHFSEATSERAAITFARNCRTCHGDVGEGGSLAGRFPAALPLNTARLQGFVATKGTLAEALSATARTLSVTSAEGLAGGDVILIDSERMDVVSVKDTEVTVKRGVENTEAVQHFKDAAVFEKSVAAYDELDPTSITNLIKNTITCGRVGTAMPTWGQAHGGPLSDEQIRQLRTLIMDGRWDLVEEEADVEDKVNAKLTEAMDAITISMFVDDVTVFNKDQGIRLGDERLIVRDVPTLDRNLRGELPDDKSGVIGVERGALGSTALEHPVETVIYNYSYYDPAQPPNIVQYSCGQTAQAPAPAGTPELIEPFTGQTVGIKALNIAFDLKEIRVNTNGQVRIRFENQDAGVRHNVAVYKSSTDLTPVSSGSVGLIFEGAATDDTVFDIPAAGSYFFRCDVHPTIMTGTFVVQ